MKLTVIGTVHGYTPKEDLIKLFEELKPAQILIEMFHEDIKNYDTEFYPEEMQFALKYAKDNNIHYFGFDTYINVAKDNPDKEYLDYEQKLCEKYNWKEWNTKEVQKLMDITRIVNKTDWDQRQKIMLENIKLKAINNAIILTGAAHLEFFERNLKSATFPFRTEEQNY